MVAGHQHRLRRRHLPLHRPPAVEQRPRPHRRPQHHHRRRAGTNDPCRALPVAGLGTGTRQYSRCVRTVHHRSTQRLSTSGHHPPAHADLHPLQRLAGSRISSSQSTPQTPHLSMRSPCTGCCQTCPGNIRTINSQFKHTAGQAVLQITAFAGEERLPLIFQIIRAGEVIYGSPADLPTHGWVSPTYAAKKPALSIRASLNTTFTCPNPFGMAFFALKSTARNQC